MVTFICPACGEERIGKRRRCYPCTKAKHTAESKEQIRQALKGVKHTDERRRKNSEAKKRHAAEGRTFDLAGYMRDKPHPFAVPPGTERISKEKGRVIVKCDDGRWRYRARLVWEKANGSIPRGPYVIHHINSDPMDDLPENLMLLTISEHRKIHADPEKYREMQRLAVATRKRNGTY